MPEGNPIRVARLSLLLIPLTTTSAFCKLAGGIDQTFARPVLWGVFVLPTSAEEQLVAAHKLQTRALEL